MTRAIELLCNGSSGSRDIEYEIAKAMLQAFELFKERHRKYSARNISRHGAMGCVVRLGDKLARLEQFYVDGNQEIFTDETLTDSWLDVLNYAAIGLVCERGKWENDVQQAHESDLSPYLAQRAEEGQEHDL
jgi:hypothetical protein